MYPVPIEASSDYVSMHHTMLCISILRVFCARYGQSRIVTPQNKRMSFFSLNTSKQLYAYDAFFLFLLCSASSSIQIIRSHSYELRTHWLNFKKYDGNWLESNVIENVIQTLITDWWISSIEYVHVCMWQYYCPVKRSVHISLSCGASFRICRSVWVLQFRLTRILRERKLRESFKMFRKNFSWKQKCRNESKRKIKPLSK